MEKFLAGFAAILLTFVIGILLTLLAAHIVLSISDTYSLDWITSNINFWQLFGLIMIIRVIKPSIPNSNDETERPFGEQMARVFGKQVTYCLFYLISWGIAEMVANFVL